MPIVWQGPILAHCKHVCATSLKVRRRKAMPLQKFIIERDIPEVGTFERDKLRGAAAKSNEVSRINKCYSRGGHVSGSNHYIGAACDNQTGWNKAPGYMYHVGDLIRQAGLYDGCRFGDCGHVAAVRGTHNRPPNLYAAIEKFKSEQSTANYQP